jgi:hypothetical protein
VLGWIVVERQQLVQITGDLRGGLRELPPRRHPERFTARRDRRLLQAMRRAPPQDRHRRDLQPHRRGMAGGLLSDLPEVTPSPSWRGWPRSAGASSTTTASSSTASAWTTSRAPPGPAGTATPPSPLTPGLLHHDPHRPESPSAGMTRYQVLHELQIVLALILGACPSAPSPSPSTGPPPPSPEPNKVLLGRGRASALAEACRRTMALILMRETSKAYCRWWSRLPCLQSDRWAVARARAAPEPAEVQDSIRYSRGEGSRRCQIRCDLWRIGRWLPRFAMRSATANMQTGVSFRQKSSCQPAIPSAARPSDGRCRTWSPKASSTGWRAAGRTRSQRRIGTCASSARSKN